MDIIGMREKIRRGEFEVSLHAEKERYAEDISLTDIEIAVFTGEILEDYSNDPRGSSCLILGYSQGRAIHVVCGRASTNWIRIITVYLPKPPKWIDDRTSRQAGEHHA